MTPIHQALAIAVAVYEFTAYIAKQNPETVQKCTDYFSSLLTTKKDTELKYFLNYRCSNCEYEWQQQSNNHQMIMECPNCSEPDYVPDKISLNQTTNQNDEFDTEWEIKQEQHNE